MENLESILWVPAILTAMSVITVIAKEYIDQVRMIKKINELSDGYATIIKNINAVAHSLRQTANYIK